MLTLPPIVGRHYLYRNVGSEELHHCEIIAVSHSAVYTHRKQATYRSRSDTGDDWTFWSDGKAKNGEKPNDYVAELVEDDELSHLRAQREAMQQRLKELGSSPGGENL